MRGTCTVCLNYLNHKLLAARFLFSAKYLHRSQPSWSSASIWTPLVWPCKFINQRHFAFRALHHLLMLCTLNSLTDTNHPGGHSCHISPPAELLPAVNHINQLGHILHLSGSSCKGLPAAHQLNFWPQRAICKALRPVLQIGSTSSQPSPSTVRCCSWVPHVITRSRAAKDEPPEKDPTSLSPSPRAEVAPLELVLLHWYRQAVPVSLCPARI